uniref:Uncharacterized protein n=1 Tax=Oryza sativa TaxID=4530 RepID=Q94HL0_ORYSA|nr:hypothetical protein [Oryza sativa]
MEYEHQVQIASLDWRNNPLGLPKWSERPKCGCRDRCQGNPRRCGFTLWIDDVNPTYDGQKIAESET